MTRPSHPSPRTHFQSGRLREPRCCQQPFTLPDKTRLGRRPQRKGMVAGLKLP
jgi:hypothetical protein